MSCHDIPAYYSTLQLARDTKCIRLLHVQGPVGAEGLDGPLRCDLTVAELACKPSYTALSYVWGVMSPIPDTIACGTVDLPLTGNAHSALRHLRAKLGAFTIWIDAVCINQLDSKEKMHQIPLMGDIYQGAAATYFWLGESNPTKAKAMDYLLRAGLDQFYFKDRMLMWEGDVYPRPWAASHYYYWYRWSSKHNPLPHHSKGNLTSSHTEAGH
jgi:hypothetical protein